MHRAHRFPLSSLIFVSALVVSGSRPVGADVTITDIGTINGRASAGVGINHAGDVAGISEFSGTIGVANGPPSEPFLTHAVLYAGALRDLGAIEGNPTCSPFGCQSAAFGVNDQDWVVGWTDNGSFGTLAFLWLPAAVPGGNSGFNVLPALSPDLGSMALAINNSGQMVGFSKPGGAISRAILWQLGSGGATLTDLGTLRSDNSGNAVALGINDLGQIAGSAWDENGTLRGFLYLPTPAYGLPAGMNNLTAGLLPGAAALCVNNRGEVAGILDGDQPFVWLPAPAYGLPAGFSRLALQRNLLAFAPAGISDGGLIVGQAAVLTNPATGEFVRKAAGWRNGGWIYLDDLVPKNSDWHLFSAEAVTRSGKTTRITGVGLLSGVTDINGLTPAVHGYVLNITCTGDLNDDGDVDQEDLAILRSQLGQSVPAGTGGDLNGDGLVNTDDVMLLAAQMGDQCLTGTAGSTGPAALNASPTALRPASSGRLLAGGSRYDLALVNTLTGRGSAENPGAASTASGNPLVAARPLTAWPLPYRGGSLQVSFSAGAGLGSTADVAIYDLSGRRVRTLSGPTLAGSGAFQWDGRDANGVAVGNGVYFLRASGDGRSAQLKIAVIR